MRELLLEHSACRNALEEEASSLDSTPEDLAKFADKPLPVSNIPPMPRMKSSHPAPKKVAMVIAATHGLVVKRTRLCAGLGVFTGTQKINRGEIVTWAWGSFCKQLPDSSLWPQGIMTLNVDGVDAQRVGAGTVYLALDPRCPAGYINCAEGPLHKRKARAGWELKANCVTQPQGAPMEDHRFAAVNFFCLCVLIVS